LSISASVGESRSCGKRQQVVDLLAYRRERLAARYRGAHAWDNGTTGHLAALLGCTRTIEESVNGTHFGPDNIAALRYGFGLRRSRVEKALKALVEVRGSRTAYEDLLHSIRELDALLDTLNQSGYAKGSGLTQVAVTLARKVNEELWAALFDASSLSYEA
jgi:hypothetical protein